MALGVVGSAIAAPPEPAPGERWVINPLFSDEFNGDSLNSDKWYDFHPLWKGRPPAKFDPSSITIADGYLQIRNTMLDEPDGDFTIAGGAVRSKSDQASFGFYEAKFKASRLTMSTTFWLSNPRTSLTGVNNLGADCPSDRWSMELDVAEQLGAPVDAAFASNFLTSQQYNTHVFYNDCDNNINDFKAGVNAAEGNGTAPADNTLPNGSESWENFNTYAAWWKDENEVDFFLNDDFSGRVQVATDLLDEPFSRTMSMNMVTETYNWGTPYPTPEQLSDDTINTSYYDWVRSYVLVDVEADAPTFSDELLKNSGFENGDLNSWVGWGPNTREVSETSVRTGQYAAHLVGPGAHEQIVSLQKNTDYRVTAYLNVLSGKVRLGAKENAATGVQYGNTEQTATNGQFEKVEFTFNTGEISNIKIFAWGLNPSEYYMDDVSIVALTGSSEPSVEPVNDIFVEEVTFKSQSYANDLLTYGFVYSSDEDRMAEVVVLDGETVVKTESFVVKAGYGHKVAQMDIGAQGDYQAAMIRIDLLSDDGNSILDATDVTAITFEASETEPTDPVDPPVEPVEPTISFDNTAFYSDTEFMVGDDLTVSVNFDTGTAGTVSVFNAIRGVRFFLRELTPSFGVVPGNQYIINDESAIGQTTGQVSATFSLAGLTPSAELAEGNFYQLFATYRASGTSKNTSVGIARVKIVGSEILRGDWDGDGDVDRLDIVEISKAITKKQEISPSFDLNDDGLVNIRDVRIMQQLCTRAGCATE